VAGRGAVGGARGLVQSKLRLERFFGTTAIILDIAHRDTRGGDSVRPSSRKRGAGGRGGRLFRQRGELVFEYLCHRRGTARCGVKVQERGRHLVDLKVTALEGSAFARKETGPSIPLDSCATEWRVIPKMAVAQSRVSQSYRIECRGIFKHKMQKMAVNPELRVKAWGHFPTPTNAWHLALQSRTRSLHRY
jgi:hypothetical protein